jgi:hypothetical protein
MEYKTGDITFSPPSGMVRLYCSDGYACVGDTITYTKAGKGDSFRLVTPSEPVVLTASQLREAIAAYAISKGLV